jgi:hypothetical protein
MHRRLSRIGVVLLDMPVGQGCVHAGAGGPATMRSCNCRNYWMSVALKDCMGSVGC